MEGDEQSFIFHTVVAVLLIGQIQFGDRNLESYITNPEILNKGKDDEI
jgi:myosin heavy subunit